MDKLAYVSPQIGYIDLINNQNWSTGLKESVFDYCNHWLYVVLQAAYWDHILNPNLLQLLDKIHGLLLLFSYVLTFDMFSLTYCTTFYVSLFSKFTLLAIADWDLKTYQIL